ncbi:MAG TPA: nitroreductase family protein [Bacteroidales bacterium]|nr:nitroreductase family protein [Bacteroidales bacterium]
MENFLDLAKKRYSVRSYLDREVEQAQVDYILECGRIAPSAANYQPWHIVVVRDPEIKKKLGETYPRDWFLQAPVLLVICGDHSVSWKRADGKDHCDIDIGILCDHLTLAAAEQGLGTCWICNFDARKCSRILEIPAHIEPMVYLPLGYPADEEKNSPRHKVRKKMEEIVRRDKF